MKTVSAILLFVLIISKSETNAQILEKPSVAFSFDDGNPNDILTYKGDSWNARIVDQLKQYHIKAIWFVAAKNINNEKGKLLLHKWNDAGHLIGNHTYNHLNYNDTSISCAEYIREIERCDSLISGYKNYRKLFRFPYLKGGNTIAKRDSMRLYFSQNHYKQGWVTIDASDWYVNMRLIKRLKENPNADISGFRDFYVSHIMERAKYYNDLSKEVNHRQIKHTVLLHFNLTSALFLGDLIKKFKAEGWNIEDYSEAIKDSIYDELPEPIPSEQSLIWMQAKQTGKYEDVLRYPGEDGEYEKDKMDKLKL